MRKFLSLVLAGSAVLTSGQLPLLAEISTATELAVVTASAVTLPAAINTIFPDTRVAAVIAERLNKDVTDVVTQADLEGITSIYLSGDSENGGYLTDLTGMELLVNLEKLSITVFSGSTDHDNVISLLPLHGLPNLSTLNLDYYDYNYDFSIPALPFSSIENFLLSLPSLTELDLDFWEVPSLNVISTLTNLTKLVINADLNVTELTLLSNLANLEYLDLSNNYDLQNLNMLPNLPNLKNIYLGGNINLSDVSRLSAFTNLEEVVLSSNKNLSDISSISNLQNLKLLLINRNNVTELPTLTNLSSLETLMITDSHITNWNVISEATNLIDLTIYGGIGENQLTLSDISFVNSLPLLSSLYVQRTSLSDISLIANHPAIKYLYLDHNYIADISPLATMPELRYSYIERQKIALPSSKVGTTVSFENTVTGVDGNIVPLTNLSNDGVYDASTNVATYTNVSVDDDLNAKFEINTTAPSIRFSGSVTVQGSAPTPTEPTPEDPPTPENPTAPTPENPTHPAPTPQPQPAEPTIPPTVTVPEPVSPNQTYIITFDGNGNDGGTIPFHSIEYQIGDTITLPTEVPTKVGYTFGGWLYNGQIFQPGDEVELVFETAANAATAFTTTAINLSFTAVWHANTATAQLPETGENSNIITASVIMIISGLLISSRKSKKSSK